MLIEEPVYVVLIVDGEAKRLAAREISVGLNDD
jgi:hypothetical protein